MFFFDRIRVALDSSLESSQGPKLTLFNRCTAVLAFNKEMLFRLTGAERACNVSEGKLFIKQIIRDCGVLFVPRSGSDVKLS